MIECDDDVPRDIVNKAHVLFITTVIPYSDKVGLPNKIRNIYININE